MTLREDYNRDGYVVVSDPYGPFIPLEYGEKEFKEIFDEGMNSYISFLSAHAKSSVIQKRFLADDIKYDLKSLGLINTFIIGQPVLNVMSPALRIPDGYYGTAAHQDWSSTQGSLDCVTVWIALTDAGIGNFPLEVIPGSHRSGLLDGEMNGSVLEVDADEKEFIPIECKAGDVVFLSGFTVHRTGAGTGLRVAVSQRFDNAAEPTFIERGYPCAQKRVIDREIKWKPNIKQVQKIYA